MAKKSFCLEVDQNKLLTLLMEREKSVKINRTKVKI